jgi:hypothetical protein
VSPTVGRATYILPVALWQDLIDFQRRRRMSNDMPSSPYRCARADAFCISLRNCFFPPLMPLSPMIIMTSLLRALSFAIRRAAWRLLHSLALRRGECFPTLASSCYRRHPILVVRLCLLARTEYVAVNAAASSFAPPDEEAAFWRLRGMRGCVWRPCHPRFLTAFVAACIRKSLIGAKLASVSI